MSNRTVTINGIPYVASPYLSFGDYDNSCMVERANVRSVLETFKNRVAMHADPAEVRDVSHFGTAFLARARNAPRRVCRAFYRPAAPYVGRSYRYGVAARAPYVLHGTGGYGYTYLWLREDVKACQDVLESLESYPSLDDDLIWQMESEAETEWLESVYGGYHGVTQVMCKILAAEYGLDVDALEDVVTVARIRDMWSWTWLESGPNTDGDWRTNGQICFVHESGEPWIDTDKVAARFLAWDTWEGEEDGLHGLCARLVEWLDVAPSLDVPGEAAPLPYGDSSGPRSDVDADTWWFGRVRPCDLDTDSGPVP